MTARLGLITFMLLVMSSAALADCTCIHTQGTVTHGETACIKTPQGYTLARCDKVQNNSSWTMLGKACDVKQSVLKNLTPTAHSRHG